MAAYVVVEMRVHDPERMQGYVAAAPATVAQHGGRYLVRGVPGEAFEGEPAPRMTLLEFDSAEAAREWYASAAYVAARAEREGAADVRMLLLHAPPA